MAYLTYTEERDELASEVYKKIGEGYEDAYQRACEMLDRATGAAAGGA
jgi:hypothetical protein